MNWTKKTILGVIALASLATVGAQANTITGGIWENVNTVSPIIDLNGSLANAAILSGGRAPDVTFSVNGPISFDNRWIFGYTIGGFLGSGGATILTGAGEAGNTLDNTFFYLTGQVTMNNGQFFYVRHSAGLQLMIGGILVFDEPSTGNFPQYTYCTWTGASGTYNFQLAYSGDGGVVEVDQLWSNGAPDGGSTLALLGGAITMLGTVARRFRK